MKTVISGVEVDLLFARVNLPEAGDALDIEKDEILKGVDDASQRSLNGKLYVPCLRLSELTIRT
jgi:poly(A) polymerase